MQIFFQTSGYDKVAFIEPPLGSNKRIWLQLRDSAGNLLREEIGSWIVVP